MIDRDKIIEIVRFLSQATFAELCKRQELLVKTRRRFHSEEMLHDLNHELRLVEQEMQARLEVSRATGKPVR